jgi:pimeloyl-ACP methyl ester carboxylesterase
MPEACERLCVLNCPHPSRLVEAFFQGRVRQLRRSWYMFFFLLPALPERLLTRRNAQVMHAIYRANAVDRTNFGLEEIAPFIEAVQKPGAASAMIAYYRVALSRGLRHPKRFAPQRPIRVPTLLLWGMEDKALGFDDLVPGTERQVPSLRVEKREGCGHFVQAEQPGWVNERLLAFFAEAASGIGATAS